MSVGDAESDSQMGDLFPLGDDEEENHRRATGTQDDEPPHPWWHRGSAALDGAAPVGDDVAAQLQRMQHAFRQPGAASARSGASSFSGRQRNDDDDASSVAASEAGNVGMDQGAPYDNYDPAIMQNASAAQPYILPHDGTAAWRGIDALTPGELRPKRAMRITVPVAYLRRDAEQFSQWQLPQGCEARCVATASLVSMLFAGTAMGIPSGRHEEKLRGEEDAEAGRNGGREKKATPLLSVGRYCYPPSSDDTDSWPMWQLGIEDLYNSDQTEVVAIAIWLFVRALRILQFGRKGREGGGWRGGGWGDDALPRLRRSTTKCTRRLI